MAKNMKLGTRLALGFGSLVAISAVLGFVSWEGLRQLNTSRGLLEQGSMVLAKLNTCAQLRREFSLYGFEKVAGRTKDSAEAWLEAHGELVTTLKTFEGTRGQTAEGSESVRRSLQGAEAYRNEFDKLIAARKGSRPEPDGVAYHR